MKTDTNSSQNTPDPILTLKNISRIVTNDGNQKTIVDSIDFEFNACEYYVICGPSGSGKSSLLRLLNRLDEPSSGSIQFLKKDQESYEPTELRKRIGYLFQTPHLFDGTVSDNIRYADETLTDEQILALAKRVRIPNELLNSDASRISVGEGQRVALARLLALEPEVILLDEPTSALDPSRTEAIEQLVKHIVSEHCTTVIMVTHDQEQAIRMGGTALLIVEGKLVETGPTEQVIGNPQTELGKMFRERKLV